MKMIGREAAISGDGEVVDISTADHIVGTNQPTGLYIGGEGDLMIKYKVGGATIPFYNHPVGYAPLNVYCVVKTGTTASNINVLR
jgi:hypothetical protein